MHDSISQSYRLPVDVEGHRKSNIFILVVDDDDWIRELLCHTLQDKGYGVIPARTAEEALEVSKSVPFDLVISDVRMPGMNGIELSHTLSITHPGLPIILITGFAQAEQARAALRQGASDFITKPFNLDTISIIIERNLERRQIEVKRVLEQDNKLMFKTVQALAAAIDARQWQTALHSRRVAYLSCSIGTRLGFSESDMRTLELAAHVHDVGKIAVSDSVLNKEGPLDETEWDAMRAHAAQGAVIVSQVEELIYVADIVRHHHEKINGSGYPDGLKGETIPILARVISVADAYECMISDRPYRKSLPIDVALSRIQEGAGTQFDQKVADCLLQLYAEGKIDMDGSQPLP
jgi:putative two-component system response regulator